ncbi:MAG: ferredoxin reductase [Nocardioidaceae bacterium]|nr:ferredoxin reductase [Nocardioidaceae bacterium]NUS49498.1 ferredoxin reductase [Nocardioidaceae bacterium]
MATPTLDWQRVRGLASRLTTPLHPDDYLSMINPLWSARELRGRVERVLPETDDAATLVIKPGWGWTFDHHPGQYIGIGVEVDGRFHWRSYSLSSVPVRSKGLLTITVRAMPEGLLSDHLVRGLEPGTIVRLQAPAGEFTLPDPPPAKLLFLVGGSGITPVMSMLRTLDRRGTMPDVVLHYSSPTKERMIFRDELRELHATHPSLTVVERYTDVDGVLDLALLDAEVPDWRERGTWACGPAPMLDAAEEVWARAGLADALHLERFSLELGESDAEGGTITFANSGKTVEADGATTVLEAGEQAGVGMPFGCRIGICHTCTVVMASGRIKDLRNGEEHAEPNEAIQTCVTVACTDLTLNI